MNNEETIKKAQATHSLTKDEIVSILNDEAINDVLFKTADEVREKHVGNEVHLRALIEFSNICHCNCKYCGLRKDNPNAQRYRLSKEEVLDFANKAKGYGYRTIVLQSGEDAYFNAEKMCEIIKEVKSLGFAITLSLGEKTASEYQAYKAAGADRYLLRIETTDEELYKEMHPNMSQQNRKKCLADLKNAGFEAGTGCLVGLPNQTSESLADDILFFKEIDADMIGIGPFIPSPDTPLANEKGGSLTLALKVMALTRLLLPDINMPATTAMETLEPNGRIKALQSGANVVMPNVTEGEYREKYEIYPGKTKTGTSEEYKKSITAKIEGIGRAVSKGYGFRVSG